MKKIMIFALIIAGSNVTIAQEQQKNCKAYKIGTFTNVDEETGASTLIERTARIQTESTDGGKNKATFNIKWKDDCSYTLKPTKETLKQHKDWPANTSFTVTITETDENGYSQESASTLNDVRVKNKITKVK